MRELIILQYDATNVMYIFLLLCTAVVYFYNEKTAELAPVMSCH